MTPQYGMSSMPPIGVGSTPVGGQGQGRVGGSVPVGTQGNKGGAGGRGRGDRESHSQGGGRKAAGELPSPNASAGQPFMPNPYMNMVRGPQSNLGLDCRFGPTGFPPVVALFSSAIQSVF
jgi:hypothetical protein